MEEAEFAKRTARRSIAGREVVERIQARMEGIHTGLSLFREA
jgi:hypothetical protein